MLQLQIDAIQTYLNEKGVKATLQKETEQLCIILKIQETEFPLFIRIFQGNELLQLLAFLPCNITHKTAGETGRLLHLLNKEVDLPGFGMDEATSVVFYRSMIPARDQQIDEAILIAFLNAIELVCKSFAPVISAVAHGAMTFEQVLHQAKQNKPLPGENK